TFYRHVQVLVYKDTNDDPESDVRIVKRSNTDTGTPVDSSSVQDPVKYKNVGVSDGVWANRNLHSYSSPSTSVSTKRVAQPTTSSSMNRRILTQYKGKRSCARNTGTGVNTRRRNVVRKAYLNRVDADHVSLPAGNNCEGSSSAHNA
ncbi:hypothetical protein Tco_0889208, partial [Tanacetum coccineum]